MFKKGRSHKVQQQGTSDLLDLKCNIPDNLTVIRVEATMECIIAD
jgi:hypothetical protein